MSEACRISPYRYVDIVASGLSDPVLRTCVAFVIIIAPGGAVIRDTGDNFRITVRGGNL